MNQQRSGLAVLARFPDLNGGKPHARADEAKGWRLLVSSGRLVGQATSIKLLAGVTLFLLVGAVLPLCIGKGSPPVNPPPAGDALSTWHPRGAETSAPSVPGKSETAALTVASRPAVRVSATAEPSSAPATLPPTAEPKREPPAVPTVAESLMMSNWPGPARANPQPARAGGEASPADANRPGARSTEYQADARAGDRQPAPVAAQFEGTIEEPGVRNRYDSTRPSIH